MITLIKGTEAACGTNAAGASTFGSATAVRLVNNGGTARLVTVIDEVGGSTTIGTFTMPGNSVDCLLYTSPSPRDRYGSRMPSSA